MKLKVARWLWFNGGDGVYCLRVGSRAFILKAPSFAPLFSERNGYDRIIRLGRGWRVTIRTGIRAPF